MTGLLDLMGAPPAVVLRRRDTQPMWRNGQTIKGSDTGFVPPLDGDLRWLAHDTARTWGRWYRWDAGEGAWCCIDESDSTGINARHDKPPALN